MCRPTDINLQYMSFLLALQYSLFTIQLFYSTMNTTINTIISIANKSMLLFRQQFYIVSVIRSKGTSCLIFKFYIFNFLECYWTDFFAIIIFF